MHHLSTDHIIFNEIVAQQNLVSVVVISACGLAKKSSQLTRRDWFYRPVNDPFGRTGSVAKITKINSATQSQRTESKSNTAQVNGAMRRVTIFGTPA